MEPIRNGLKFSADNAVDFWLLEKKKIENLKLCCVCYGMVVKGAKCSRCRERYCKNCLEVYEKYKLKPQCCPNPELTKKKIDQSKSEEKFYVPSEKEMKVSKIASKEIVSPMIKILPLVFVNQINLSDMSILCERKVCGNKLLPSPPIANDGRHACGEICKHLMNMEKALSEGESSLLKYLEDVFRKLYPKLQIRKNPKLDTEMNKTDGRFCWCWDGDHTHPQIELSNDHLELTSPAEACDQKMYAVSLIPIQQQQVGIFRIFFEYISITCNLEIGITQTNTLESAPGRSIIAPNDAITLTSPKVPILTGNTLGFCIDYNKKKKVFINYNKDSAKEIGVTLEPNLIYYLYMLFKGEVRCKILPPVKILESSFRGKYT